MTSSIAFHSYKGGTGKTTIASNFAASLARKGYRVCMLDLDVYAPSLQSYFEVKPIKWINDYLFSNAEIHEIITDLTGTVKVNGGIWESSGKLWVGFCNTRKEEIQRLEAGNTSTKKQLFRKLVSLREQLISEYDADYIIIDTSPGIRYWSINALAIADIFLLTLKMGDIDIDGTKMMANEIYSSFTKHGSKSFLLCNRVSGYCVPDHSFQNIIIGSKSSDLNYKKLTAIDTQEQLDQTHLENNLSDYVGIDVISSIPCYCDIQFTRKEFLTVLRHPDHPFAQKIEHLGESVQKLKTDG